VAEDTLRDKVAQLGRDLVAHKDNHQSLLKKKTNTPEESQSFFILFADSSSSFATFGSTTIQLRRSPFMTMLMEPLRSCAEFCF
jgi:hypothetical protein